MSEKSEKSERAMTIVSVLKDISTGKCLPVNIEIFEDKILIRPEGFGDKCSSDGEGSPIMIEHYDGKVRAFIWGDINQEDPTDVVDLENAKESNRKENA